jgi:hypothetical protein
MRDFYLELVTDPNRLLFLLEFRLNVIRNAKAVKRLEKLRATGLAELDAFLREAFGDSNCEIPMQLETMHRVPIGLLYGFRVESLFRPRYLSQEDTRASVFAFIEHIWPARGVTSIQRLSAQGHTCYVSDLRLNPGGG